MIGVLLFMAGLWALGAAFGTPRRSRLLAMAVLWGLAGVALVALPAGQPVRRIMGDDLRVWAALTVLAALGLGYAWLLTRLKARAVTDQPKTATAGTFTPTASGFPAPIFSLTAGSLPTGVNFTSGVLSGTPTPGQGGVFPLTFTATNSVGTAPTQAFTLTVTEPAAITSAATTTFTVGTAGTFSFTATAPFPTRLRR